MQAKLEAHSLLPVHSGLQYGGEPEKLGIQEQEGESAISLHIELGPHGEGVQGVASSTGDTANEIYYYSTMRSIAHPEIGSKYK